MKRSPLDPKSYGRATRWKCDFDEEYLKSLSPEDLAWLERFALAEYGGTNTGLHTQEQMQEIWRGRERASQDILNLATSFEDLVTDPKSLITPENLYAAKEVRKKHPVRGRTSK